VVLQSRNLEGKTFTSEWKQLSANNWYPVSNGKSVVTYQGGFQQTDSYRSGAKWQALESEGFKSTSGSELEFIRELQQENREGLGNDQFDTGHPFSTQKTEYLWPSAAYVQTRMGPLGDYDYNGYFLPVLSPSPPTFVPPTTSRINADGAALIGMTTPTKPELALAQFLGELHEGLPSLIGAQAVRERMFNARITGKEYLNYQFGIVPFINDIQSMAQGVLRAHKLVDAYLRNANHYVRRRAQLDRDSQFTEQAAITSPLIVHIPFSGLDGQYLSSNVPTTRVFDSFTEDVWFSGAYTFYVEQGHSFLNNVKRWAEKANHLLGLELTPQLVWELTPWSWLVDWFADVNGFLRNVQSFADDSLVLKYGYVMHKTQCVRTYTKVGLKPTYDGKVPPSSTMYVTVTDKRRTKATPYGFGLDLQSLSPRRWAILAALGLTKAPNSLGP